MWHSPNQRLRALANARKREKERARRPFHVKRIMATLNLLSSDNSPTSDPPVMARVVLNDLSTTGVGLFSQIPLVPGQEINMSVSEPVKITIHARIVWCKEHAANSHVLSNQAFSYRLGVEFNITNEEDRKKMNGFWEEICKSHLYSVNTF